MTSPADLYNSWIEVYLQVTVSILIFGLGIPALLMQITMSEGIWHIVRKPRRRMMTIVVFFGVLNTVVTFSLIWFFHRCGVYVNELALIADLRAKVAPPWMSPQLFLRYLIVDISMTLTVLGVVVVCLVMPSFRRGSVLDRRTKRCIKRIKREGSVYGPALQDIRYLGEQSESGIEKTQVLEALDAITEQMLAREGYVGDGRLEPVLQTIEVTLRSDRDIDDLLYGIEILGKAIGGMQQQRLVSSPDMGFCLRALQRIGALVLELNADDAAFRVLSAVTPVMNVSDGVSEPVARVLYELGAVAIGKELYACGVRALSYLEAILRRESSSDTVRADYLGLVAHFWALGGTALEHARRSTTNLWPLTALDEHLQQAREHHYMRAQFETADKLDAMLADIRQELTASSVGSPSP